MRVGGGKAGWLSQPALARAAAVEWSVLSAGAGGCEIILICYRCDERGGGVSVLCGSRCCCHRHSHHQLARGYTGWGFNK